MDNAMVPIQITAERLEIPRGTKFSTQKIQFFLYTIDIGVDHGSLPRP